MKKEVVYTSKADLSGLREAVASAIDECGADAEISDIEADIWRTGGSVASASRIGLRVVKVEA
ncbi:hypothetical protein [Brevibacterium moorei]|uniref:hypothetical protein n=1 Tax=Brevibacterium moorei TaxID=2968457 RepID=UPI00211BC905|nr:hypothetical protein [Brevibacterium sp. 68QC2CO]MCQ9385151.1 hypothetical protein [Brevibacterium sp. 68QC2CO]